MGLVVEGKVETLNGSESSNDNKVLRLECTKVQELNLELLLLKFK